MQREILFKGFAPNQNGKETIYKNGEEIKGEWVYGYYGKTKRICTSQQAPGTFFNIHYIMVAEEIERGETYLKDYEILPETLSQFTGLLDKAGNKIFENDIVKCAIENPSTGKVEKYFNCVVTYCKTLNAMGWYGKDERNVINKIPAQQEFLEIIGNRFD